MVRVKWFYHPEEIDKDAKSTSKKHQAKDLKLPVSFHQWNSVQMANMAK